MFFVMIFWDVIFWDDITIFWDENYVNKLFIGPKHFFSQLENQNKFSTQNIVISSQNNVPKYLTKEHEQVFW